MIYRASQATKSKQVSSPLSKDLKKKFSKNSVRVIEGDTVKIVRGEFKGVDGKISEVSVQESSIAIEGVKKEKTKGDKFDVFIHTSNLVVTSLNTDDKWRIAKLEGKDPRKQPKETPKKEAPKVEEKPKETKVEKKSEKKEDEN